MRNKILVGLTTAIATASIAAPAMAQAPPISPAAPQAPSSASVKISQLNVKHSRNAGGYTWASATISVTNMTGQSFNLRYKSNLKTFNPGTMGPWRPASGTLGFSGPVGGNETWAIKLAVKGKSVAQVRKSLKLTFTNPGGGATITNPTAVATPAAS
jgi:hypothetical protein